MTLRGIDISSHQPTEDWARIARAGISFAAVKLTGGTSYANPYHDRQVAGARAAGLAVIHYHYAGEPTGDPADGVSEARYFLAHLGSDLLEGEGVSLDFEEEGVASAGWALNWLQTVEQALGFKPSFYTYPSFMDSYGLHQDALAAYPLWYASYRATRPQPPRPWPSIYLWQNSADGDVPGVGHVDVDEFDGTLAELRAFGKPPAVTALANATTGDVGAVRGYINGQGEAILEINYGGVARSVVGTNVVDAGLSVQNDQGEIYDRSIRGNAFEPWRKR